MRVAVIGAGATGLAAARELHARGISVVVYDAQERVGGTAWTIRDGGWQAEWGPNTLAAGDDVVELLRGFGVAELLVDAAPDATRRFLVRKGLPREVPTKPPKLLASSLFPLGAKLALVTEPWRRPRSAEAPEETVADFVRRRLNDEWLQQAVGPFVSGVYAGDPEKLSLPEAFPRMQALEQTYGSLIKGAVKLGRTGALRRMLNAPGGIGSLMTALAAPLPEMRFGSPLAALKRSGSAWRVRTVAGEEDSFDQIVLTVPAHPAAALIRPLDAELAARLEAVDYPPMVVVHHGYARDHVAHPLNGFGVLIPRREGIRTLGTLFPSSMFAGRTPAGHVLLTSYIGGALDRDILSASDADVLSIVLAENACLFGIGSPPAWTRVIRVERAIPQYNLGHGGVRQAARNTEERLRGLFLRGNYTGGIALGDRLLAGVQAARDLLSSETA